MIIFGRATNYQSNRDLSSRRLQGEFVLHLNSAFSNSVTLQRALQFIAWPPIFLVIDIIA